MPAAAYDSSILTHSPLLQDYSKDAKNNAERSTQGEIRVFFGDQANPQHLDQLIVELGGDFDVTSRFEFFVTELMTFLQVIIDDGGHMPTQQITTFKHLFKKALRPGGCTWCSSAFHKLHQCCRWCFYSGRLRD